MIREIRQEDVAQCVKVIRDSFFTVAEEFGFTEENAPRFTAFATDEQRINWHLNGEHRPMFGYFEGDRLIGYYSLLNVIKLTPNEKQEQRSNQKNKKNTKWG